MDLDPESEDKSTQWPEMEPTKLPSEEKNFDENTATLPGQMPIVRYLVADNARFYRVVVDILLEEESRLGLHLPVAEIEQRVLARVNNTGEGHETLNIATLLGQLFEWKNVDRIYNTRRAGTSQEYLKKDFLYQLTPVGAEVHKKLVAIDRDLGAPGALQSSMLPEVRDALVELATLLKTRFSVKPPEDTLIRTLRTLQRIINGFTQLSENAKLFIQGLNQALDLTTDLKLEVFLAYKDVVVSYLENFVTELLRYSASICANIRKAEQRGILELLPELAGLEAAPAIGRSRQEVVDHDTEVLRNQWDRLRSWFLGDPQREPVAKILQQRSAEAVNRILIIVRRINDQRFRRINRSSDLLILASWFEGTADPIDRATLWRNAFGMYSARHFGAAHDPVNDLALRPNTSWWTSPAAPVSPSLRTRGPRSSTGRPLSIRDPSRNKRELAARRTSEMAGREAAIHRFTALSPTFLSALPVLNTAELELLLDCLKVGMSAVRRTDGARRARTGDGRLRIQLRQPSEGGDRQRRVAVVRTELGLIAITDFELTIEDVHRGSR